MFQVLAPVIIHPSAEARAALGAQLQAAGRAAWCAIAARKQGLEFAHLQFCFADTTLALASRLRPDGFLVIELGLGDPRQAARVITAAQFPRLHTSRRTIGARA